MPPTLTQLLALDPKAEIAVSCLNTLYEGDYEQHRLRGHSGGHYLVSDLAAMYGGETTLEQIRLRFRCKVCGGRGSGILADPVIHQAGFSAGGYRLPEG